MFDKLKRVFTGYGPGPDSKVIDDRQSADSELTKEKQEYIKRQKLITSVKKVLKEEPKSNYEKWCDENPSDRNCKMYDV